MNTSQALAKRIAKLLDEKNITLYRLAQDSGVFQQTLTRVLRNEQKTVTFATVVLIARGFNMTLLEFLDDPLFKDENLNV